MSLQVGAVAEWGEESKVVPDCNQLMKLVTKKFIFMLYVEKCYSFHHMGMGSVVICFEVNGAL